MKDDNIKYWFSLDNGVHIPVKEGESKREAVSKVINKKSNIKKRNTIEEFKEKKQSNNKIKKMVKKGNTYIPIRENENEKDVLKQHELRNNPDAMRNVERKQYNQEFLKRGVRLNLGKKGANEVAEAKAKKGLADDYSDIYEKIDKQIPLTGEEFKKWATRPLQEGDLVLGGIHYDNGDVEDAIVGKNGEFKKIPKSYYKDIGNGEKLYVGKKNATINKYKKRKGK